MMPRQVAFIANSLESAYKFQRVLSDLGVEVSAGSILQMRNLIKPGAIFDLVIFEAIEKALPYLEEVRSIVENQGLPLLVIVDEEGLVKLSLPHQVPSDFVIAGASRLECAVRVTRLLSGRMMSASDESIAVDDMVINLNTYQVTVGDAPIDFTYLEYTLLAFFANHPNRAFTRETLLQEVWGFDYFGGSRTVDVHVRRIRAKLGPKLAQRLETVRGVGYLWSSKE